MDSIRYFDNETEAARDMVGYLGLKPEAKMVVKLAKAFMNMTYKKGYDHHDLGITVRRVKNKV